MISLTSTPGTGFEEFDMNVLSKQLAIEGSRVRHKTERIGVERERDQTEDGHIQA